jgi:hypothetical protein
MIARRRVARASQHNPMQRRILSITALLSLVMMAMSGCGTSNDKADSMKSKQGNKPSGVLESDPKFYKLNSVLVPYKKNPAQEA